MKKIGTLFSALACVSLLALAGACGKQGSSQPAAQKADQADVSTRQVVRTVQPDYTIKLAYLDAGTWPSVTKAPLPEHAFGLVFKSVVEANSNGKIAVELYPNDQLGGTKEVQGMV
jgi:TRAP-type C4-dicarboxylate transport system substrate-binding protein